MGGAARFWGAAAPAPVSAVRSAEGAVGSRFQVETDQIATTARAMIRVGHRGLIQRWIRPAS